MKKDPSLVFPQQVFNSSDGKSKFYNTTKEAEMGKKEKSQFYRQEGVDLKTPSVENDGGFRAVFRGESSQDEPDTETEEQEEEEEKKEKK